MKNIFLISMLVALVSCNMTQENQKKLKKKHLREKKLR